MSISHPRLHPRPPPPGGILANIPVLAASSCVLADIPARARAEGKTRGRMPDQMSDAEGDAQGDARRDAAGKRGAGSDVGRRGGPAGGCAVAPKPSTPVGVGGSSNTYINTSNKHDA